VKEASPRKPVVGGSIEEHRRTLGLADVRPSELVEGLAEAAAKAEKKEQSKPRQTAKRLPGQIAKNVALQVGETGRRWRFYVLLGVISALTSAAGVALVLGLIANRRPDTEHEMATKTRGLMQVYENIAGNIAPFPKDATVSKEDFKIRLKAVLEAELKQAERAIEVARAGGRSVGPAELRRRALAREALAFRDGWGESFVFEMDGQEALLVKCRDPKKVEHVCRLKVVRDGGGLEH
jgi:hypothetical protein